MMLLALREGLRIYRRARRVKRKGFRTYEGSAEQMCHAIIRDAYDQRKGYFRVSSGHFCEFYARDFAWCAPALLELGYRDEVASTLRYALARYVDAGKITTMITPEGTAYDFPCYGPDALALFLETLVQANAKDLVREHKKFLQQQVDRLVEKAFDHEILLPKEGRFTSMRDQAGLDRSCYDACMIAITARACERLGLQFPASYKHIKKMIIATYWNGEYFFSDVRKQEIVVGDANVVPFWFGIVNDQKMLRSAFGAIRNAWLDVPFPLKYVSSEDKRKEWAKWHLASHFTPDYETDSIWMHMGVPYVRLLATIDREAAVEHVKKYTENLKKHGTFLEIYTSDGRAYQTPFYVTDEAMLWCAPYVTLAKKLKVLK